MRFFVEQFDRFSKGVPLQNIVDKKLGIRDIRIAVRADGPKIEGCACQGTSDLHSV